MNDIATQLQKLEQQRIELLKKQDEIDRQQRRIAKNANKSIQKTVDYTNEVGQVLKNGSKVVVVRGIGSRSSYRQRQSILGIYIGANVSPQGEIRSLRVAVDEPTTYWIDSAGREYKYRRLSMKEPVRKRTEYHKRTLAVKPNRVFLAP